MTNISRSFGAAVLCSLALQAAIAQNVSTTERAQIAAIRAELSRFSPGQYVAPHSFCVGVKAHVGDPSPEFLAALSGVYQNLVALSQCSSVCPEQKERALESRAVLLPCGYVTAGDVWMEPGGQANLSIRFTAGPRWGRIGVYRLREVNGHWEIVGYELHSVS